MKRIITLSVFALMLQMASAQIGFMGSTLNLRTNDNFAYRLFIDGIPATTVAGNTFTITNLEPGQHTIELYREGLRSRGNRYGQIFRNTINVAPRTEYFASVYVPQNIMRIERTLALGRPEVLPLLPGRDNCQNFPNNSYNDYDRNNHCATPVPAGPMAMNSADFSQLIATIHNGSFESTKLNIFKQALAYNYFTTQQVRTIMNEFWFESTKLDVAKLAYGKTLDQNNYYQVNNEFSFSSSVNELGDYIAMR